MKVSFDFDSTLDNPVCQKLAKVLRNGGAEVFIITTRGENTNNRDVLEVANDVGIPFRNIHFIGNKFKQSLVAKLGIDLHIDDGWDEVEKIRQGGGKAMLFNMNIFEIADGIQGCEDINEQFLKDI